MRPRQHHACVEVAEAHTTLARLVGVTLSVPNATESVRDRTPTCDQWIHVQEHREASQSLVSENHYSTNIALHFNP